MVIPFTLLIQPEQATCNLVSLWMISAQAACVEKTSILDWALLSSRKAFAEGIGECALGIVDAHLGRHESVGVTLSSTTML